jgi:arabinogalactan oligomer / maltooligosaccharide transport system substrate-binding protein
VGNSFGVCTKGVYHHNEKNSHLPSLSVLTLGLHAKTNSTPRLQIAVDSNYIEYFQRVTSEFKKTHDVEFDIVQVQMFDMLESLPIQRGNSADIFMVVDAGGDLAAQRLLMPLTFSLAGYTDNSLIAGRYQGNSYFVPMSTDTTLLIYNKDKVSGVPATLGSIPASNFAAKFTDFYFAAGMLHTMGGYVFGESEQDLGIASPGSIAAGTIMGSLYSSGVKHWELMKDDSISYDIMMNAFTSGEVDYIINGPWSLADIASAGINAGIAPIPSWDGSHPFRALISTKGLSLNAYTKHPELAQTFLAFLATKEYAQLWYEMTGEVAPHTGVVYPAGSLQEGSYNATAIGLAIPNTPALQVMWVPMADALKQIANGAEASAALGAAQTRLMRDIEDAYQN